VGVGEGAHLQAVGALVHGEQAEAAGDLVEQVADRVGEALGVGALGGADGEQFVGARALLAGDEGVLPGGAFGEGPEVAGVEAAQVFTGERAVPVEDLFAEEEGLEGVGGGRFGAEGDELAGLAFGAVVGDGDDVEGLVLGPLRHLGGAAGAAALEPGEAVLEAAVELVIEELELFDGATRAAAEDRGGVVF
jgi:hypothetical protein